MDGPEPLPRPQPLRMARGKSPWGSGPQDNQDQGPPAETTASAEENEPRNPWLNPDEEPRPRRSASIEDILRPRPGGSPLFPGGFAAAVLAGLAAVWLAATSLHVLERDERALVLTMGRFSSTIGPGLNLTLPWPFQSVLRRKVGADELSLVPDKEGETLMPTRDGELVNVAFRVRWRVTDLKAFAFNLPEGEAAIRRLADAQVRAAVAELPFDAVYGSDKRGQLQARATERMQKVLSSWKAGVTVVGIELVQVSPPARLAETFKQIETARDNARRQRENDEAWRQQQITAARREAAEFDRVYTQYKLAPQVTRQKMYYETIERILRKNPAIVGGSGPAVPMPPMPTAKPAGQ